LSNIIINLSIQTFVSVAMGIAKRAREFLGIGPRDRTKHAPASTPRPGSERSVSQSAAAERLTKANLTNGPRPPNRRSFATAVARAHALLLFHQLQPASNGKEITVVWSNAKRVYQQMCIEQHLEQRPWKTVGAEFGKLLHSLGAPRKPYALGYYGRDPNTLLKMRVYVIPARSGQK
jgi:hypothetical protein